MDVVKKFENKEPAGQRHATGLQVLTRPTSHHGRGAKPWPCCKDSDLVVPVLTHFLEELAHHSTKLKIDHVKDYDASNASRHLHVLVTVQLL